MKPRITYSIHPTDPKGHRFEVDLLIQEPTLKGQLLQLPRWIPGSYMIRDFSKHVESIKAHSFTSKKLGQTINLHQVDNDTWQMAPHAGPVLVQIVVYAFDTSVSTAYLDQFRGFCNHSSLCLQVLGQTDQPCQIIIHKPTWTSGWEVVTTLPKKQVNTQGFGTYQASSYEELIDHPVSLGKFQYVKWISHQIPHLMVIQGATQLVDTKRLSANLQAICNGHITFFEPKSSRAPFNQYIFHVNAVSQGYGGLEHHNSTALLCKRSDLPYKNAPDSPSKNTAYEDFLGLCSHEYFHAWLVKRIQPLAFQPYQLDRKNFSTLLWFFEGFTSYYDDLLLLRSACISKEHYLNRLLRTVNQIQKNPGRHKQSVSDSSFDAWTKYYQMDANTPNAVVSYYAKGSLIAFALDLLIREATQHVKSLDDVMRLLWQRHGSFRHTPGLGLSEHDFENAVLTVTGVSFKDKWQNFALNYIKGTADIPVIELLASQGIRTTKKRLSITEQIVSQLGVRTANQDGWLKITQVLDHALAQQAGLAPDDVIVSLNQERVTPTNWLKLLEQFSTQPLKILAFRSDQLKTFYIPNRIKPITEYVLQVP